MSNALETAVEIGTPVLEGTDHVELWVGNARQAAYHYRNAFGFDDLGKRKFGREETLFFTDELVRIYGSDDPDIAEGASFAVEHWAAAGFWKQLIKGLEGYRQRECPELRLAFFTWHDRVEDQHAAHTMDELEGAFRRPGFDQQKFLEGAAEMLDGVKAFWDGLEKRRLELEAVAA